MLTCRFRSLWEIRVIGALAFCRGVHAAIVLSHVRDQVDTPRGASARCVVKKRSGGLRPPQAAASRTTLLGVPQAIDPWYGTPKLKIPPSDATSQ